MPTKPFAALALIFLISTAAWAQDHVIHGYVIAPSKQHIENFELFLTSRDAEDVISHTTVGAYGEFMLKNIPTGYYDILIRLPGFRESRTPLLSGNPESILADRQLFITMNIVLVPDSNGGPFTPTEAAYMDAVVDEYGKGIDAIINKQPELAVPHLENVLREVPEFTDAHINLGLVYQDLSRRNDAEKEFRKAIELSPDSSRAFLALGVLFLQDVETLILSKGAPDDIHPKLLQTREAFSQASILDPKSAKAFYHLGAVDYRLASYETAESELKHALELDSKIFPARIMLVNVYIQMKLWQEALDNADIFLIENPGSPFRSDVTYTRSQLLRRLQGPLLR